MAFMTVSRTLRLFIEERQSDRFGVHCFDVRFTPRKAV
jgi:hypothetical protein